MEQLDLDALLARSYDVCDALMRADVGKVRSEGRELKVMLRNDLALMGAYLVDADRDISDEEVEFIRTTLGFPADALIIEDIRKRKGLAAEAPKDVPQCIKYAVVADAESRLDPDPFARQCSMYFFDTFKVFGQHVLALYAPDVPEAEVQRFTEYMDRLEKTLDEYAVWRPVSQ